jgi:hypothetical protein
MIGATDIARELAARAEMLARDLLPGGHREGHEWRAGSIAGEAGSSLGLHLGGSKPGIWADFASGDSGDALDLVKAALKLDMPQALAWARRWLGIDAGEAAIPRRPLPPPAMREADADPDRWRHPWDKARPIAGTLAERYLRARGLQFDDPEGDVLRFASRRARKSPDGDLQHHPALLAALRDAVTGEQVGVINIYLAADSSDRIRDSKGKTVTGRARRAVVMLDDFADVTMGLILCEGVETGTAIHQSGLRPVWACGGAGTLATFPVLGGIECLTVAADADDAGKRAAEAVSARWRDAGREVRIVAPPSDDWAAPC